MTLFIINLAKIEILILLKTNIQIFQLNYTLKLVVYKIIVILATKTIHSI